MADDAKLLAVIEANTKNFENALKRLERTTDQSFRKQVNSAKQLDKTLNTLSATALTFGKAIAAGIGVATVSQLPGLIRDVVATTAAMGDLADKVGISTDALQALHYQAEQNGSSAEALDSALEQFARRTAEAATGSGELAKILAKNNVELRNSDGSLKTLEQRLADYANLIQNAANESDALVLATEAFGRAGDDMAIVFRTGSRGIREYMEAARRLGHVLDAEVIRRAQETDDKFAELERTLTTFAKGEVLQFVDQLTQAVTDLGTAAEATGDFIATIATAVTARTMGGIIAETKAWREELERLRPVVDEIEKLRAVTKTPITLIEQATLDRFQELQMLLRSSNEELAKMVGTDFSRLISALRSVADELRGFLPFFQQIGRAFGIVGQTAATVLPTSGTKSATGKTVNELAAALIAEVEGGVLEQAKWDVNHWRVGFSSDTQTDLSGKWRYTTKESVSTVADAWRDLNRRIAEAQTTLIEKLGQDAYNRLTEGEKAALTSVLYQHGENNFPTSLVTAAQSGQPGAVAAGIEALPGFRIRRLREAQVAMGGDVKAYDALIAKEEEAAQKQAEYNEKIAEFEALLIAEGHAVKLETDALFASTAQKEYLAEKQRLENELTAAGIPITTEYAAAIERLAQQRAANVVVQEQADVALQREQDAMQLSIEKADQLRTAFSDVAGGLATDLLNGVKPAEALANALGKILDQLIQIGVQQLSAGLFGPMGSPLGGILGGFLTPVLHGGGVVGQAGTLRRVNPMVFAGAPRFHNGGLPGLASGEVAAILKKGEIVMPAMPTVAGMSARARNNQRVGVDVNVGIEPSPLFVATVDTRARQAEESAVRRSAGYITDRTRRQAGGRI